MSKEAKENPIWRGLEELEDSPRTRELLEREFPQEAMTPLDELKRRSFLKLMGATLAAAGMTACTRQPIEQIVPWVRQPEEIVPGKPLFFATAMPLSGYGTGIIVQSREGRPIKADGNPLHPASGNGSNIWLQACLLDLYNPERARAVQHLGNPSSFALFSTWLHERLREQRARRGAGMRLLTGSVTSPTLSAQIGRFLGEFPEARWHQWEPVNWDNALAGAELAFGERLATHYHLEKAAVIASFESDFLYTHPERLRYTRAFTDGRRVVAGQKTMNRLYVLESSPTVTGSMADNRLPIGPEEAQRALCFVARELGIAAPNGSAALTDEEKKFLRVMSRDLRANAGKCAVMVGEVMAPEFHALEQAINEKLGNLGNTVSHTLCARTEPVSHLASLASLVDDMERGAVEFLVILGGNPVFDAPADFAFASRLEKVANTVHSSEVFNETSRRCEWNLPQAHFLEAWSDVRSFDGTATIMQPLIAPLFGGRSEHEIVDLFSEIRDERSGYDIIREYWRAQNIWPDFETSWQVAVHGGVVAGTALPRRDVRLRTEPKMPASEVSAPRTLSVTFRPDPNLWDGRFALNPWLQEAPKPLTKLTWDNAAMISPSFAEREQLRNGDVIEVGTGEFAVRIPVFILPGQAEKVLTLHFGPGRGTEVTGFNVYPLRRSGALWHQTDVLWKKLASRYELVSTQTHHRTHSEDRQVYRDGTLAHFLEDPNFVKESTESPAKEETLYDPHFYDYPIKWGMAIDLTTCIGCNACLMACNVENNIPIVGKKQVSLNREMLWLRIDTYYSGDLRAPKYNHQPVPCMHCENAPCEYVCPVDATLHDHEGLNLQVYNRCIGTRYCSNNCPYKVRRFNFLRYADYHSELDALRHNPEVTVRWRGVMEKCTYCVQRIAAARIRAKEEDRPIRDGEVRTACQEACPAGAIVFGMMSDQSTAVSELKRSPLEFPMLGQLNTRPRTTYSAKLRNPNPELEGSEG